VVEGFVTGMHKSSFHGFSVAFSERKLYNKGESINVFASDIKEKDEK